MITAGLTTALVVTASAWAWLDPGRAGTRHNSSGDKYLRNNKPAEAIIEYRAALKNTPNSAPTFRKLGDAYRENGELGRAADAFRYAADLMAEDLRSQLVAGWYSLVQHRPDDARRYAQRVLDLDPNNTSAARLLANAMACFGDFAEGLEILRTAAEHEPLNAATYGEIGLLEAANGDGDAAAVAYERSRELTPRGQTAWLGGMGSGRPVVGADRTPPAVDGIADPAPPAQLPGTSETGGPTTVVETTLDGRRGTGPPPIVVIGSITTSPDGGTSVQFTAVDGGTGRPIDGLAAAQSSASPSPSISEIPEPASLLLLMAGGIVGGGSRWLRRRRTKGAI